MQAIELSKEQYEICSGIHWIFDRGRDWSKFYCVVNLSPNKKQVLSSVGSVLKEGAKSFLFNRSDRVLWPQITRKGERTWGTVGECIAGALYIGGFVKLCKETGFNDPRVVSISNDQGYGHWIERCSWSAKFYPITYRLFKLNNLEPQCEDYGQYAARAILKVTSTVMLWMIITSLRLENLFWLSKYFDVIGSRQVHYGPFTSGAASK